MCCSCHEMGCLFVFFFFISFRGRSCLFIEWSSTQLACMHSASSDESKDFSSNFVAIVAKGSANCEQLLALICTRACELLLSFFFFFPWETYTPYPPPAPMWFPQ